MKFHRDQYLRPNVRRYTEAELRYMARVLRRLNPASPTPDLYRSKRNHAKG
jgi:hypothetical protein